MTSTMTRPAPSAPSALRVGTLLLGALTVAGLALALAWQQAAPVARTLATGAAREIGVADLLVAAATVVALLLVAWIALGLAVGTLAVARPHGSVLRVAETLAPSAIRRLAAALVGAAVLSYPAVGLAHAAEPGPTPTTSAPTSSATTTRATVGTTAEEPVVPRFVPTPPPRVTHAPPPSVAHRLVHEDEIVVRRGDTLWTLAARHLGPGATLEQVAEAWPRWYAQNRAVIGTDPGLLLPGQRLRPPTGGRA